MARARVKNTAVARDKTCPGINLIRLSRFRDVAAGMQTKAGETRNRQPESSQKNYAWIIH
jgi:hypothetical protein